uniref:Uncharacterized protein n=1 Tax=Fusarium oxysporum (strain Fo5176) TaxID=660025 RepID=A0A0D2YFJ4_FUSOF
MTSSRLERRWEIPESPTVDQAVCAVSLPTLTRMRFTSYHSGSNSRDSPLFAARIILHPRFGISWLEATWVSEEQLAWVRDAKVGIKDYFTRWYDMSQSQYEETMQYNAASRTMDQEDDQNTQWINSKTKKAFLTGGSVGELERYLRLEPQDTLDAIQW